MASEHLRLSGAEVTAGGGVEREGEVEATVGEAAALVETVLVAGRAGLKAMSVTCALVAMLKRPEAFPPHSVLVPAMHQVRLACRFLSSKR